MELYVRWHNVPNQGPSILAVSIVFVSLSGLAVGTRLVRRLCMVGGGMGVDDWLISFALVSLSARFGPSGRSVRTTARAYVVQWHSMTSFSIS